MRIMLPIEGRPPPAAMPPMASTPLPVVAPTQYRDSGGVTCCSGAAFDPAFGACARPDTPTEIAMAGTAATITARDVRMCIPSDVDGGRDPSVATESLP